jgi:predicted SAM-dependent methyltransferase
MDSVEGRTSMAPKNRKRGRLRTEQAGIGLIQGLRREIRRKRATLFRGSAIASYLESHRVRKLHIGAGHNHLPGWLNTDRDPNSGAVYLDAAEPFPFEDATFDYVYSEHLIEHLPYEAGLAMLEECRRVLKPGGRIRIATPDMEQIVGLQYASPSGIEERYARWLTESYFPEAVGDRWAVYATNQVFRGWGHQFLYDQETLGALLEKVGFTAIRPRPFRQSDDVNLIGVEGHGIEAGNQRMSEFKTMILEATRP